MWEAKGNIKPFITSIMPVNRNAVVRVEPGRLYCRALSMCNTIYGTFDYEFDVKGDNSIIPLPIGMIDSIVGNSEIELRYNDRVMVIKSGRSKYRIVELAQNVIKEPKVLTLDIKAGVIVNPTELFNAIKDIGNYYSTDTFVPPVRFQMCENELKISDMHNNVETDIQCIKGNTIPFTETVESYQGYDNLYRIMDTVRKLSDEIVIGIKDISTPMKIIGEKDALKFCYVLAPRIPDGV